MRRAGCVLLGCDWGPSWMSSDGYTRRICRRCGVWRGIDLEPAPLQGDPVYIPPSRRAQGWG